MTDTTGSMRLTPGRRRIIDRALDALLDLDPGERRARLREIEARTPRVHRFLRRLVEASEDAGSYLDEVLGKAGKAAITELEQQQADLAPGTRIGDWRIVEPIGVGGMGMVYRAERADGAFEMTVAIKFIRAQHDPLMAERLALETQLLARLDHPNIARIVDGGTTADGRNYLVMEWIEGEDLADRAGLDRLALLDPRQQRRALVQRLRQHRLAAGGADVPRRAGGQSFGSAGGTHPQRARGCHHHLPVRADHPAARRR